MRENMIRALLLCCLLAFPVAAKKPVKPPPPACPSAFGWSCPTTVAGVVGNYTPVVQMGGSQIRVYANTSTGSVDGNLYLRVGSWSSVGSASMLYDTPAGSDDYIRTLGVAQGASGAYYAVLYVGPCYGCTNGFSPAWATSPDGFSWTYHGRISPFGINQSSANNLIVDESRTDAYRFMFWMDVGANLYLVHSTDGATWISDGINQWPIAGEQAQFASAVKTPYGYHIIAAIGFPAIAHRHVFSCTGLPPWRVIEMDAYTRGTAQKGPNLVYDNATNLIHALTSGMHYTLPARQFPC